jgi:hypothetical protein
VAPSDAKYTDWYGLAIAAPTDHRAEVEVSIHAFLGR